MENLKRKIDNYLLEWKNDVNRLPLIIKGARQVGKTTSIEKFANENYESFIEINFIENPEYKDILANGYQTDSIIRNISLKNPSFKFIPNKTLIFFDEIQKYPDIATSLKFFKTDGRYDIICSGSLMGINYNEIESNSVGYKTDYIMQSMDFEEFLWAKGYNANQIEDLYRHMVKLEPLSNLEMNVFNNIFIEYLIIGGMPAIVKKFIENKNYSGILDMQKQIIKDYEEDITQYAGTLDKTKILNVYKSIKIFLGKENKKFQITKVEHGARNRDYVGVVDWLDSAGIVNVSYCMNVLETPLNVNYNPDNMRLYFADTGLLIGSLDKESQEDLRNNKNFNTYKGAIYENIVGDMLVKSGYQLYFYRNEKSTVEIDFVIRDSESIIPIEVKASNSQAISLNRLIEEEQFNQVKYGFKLCNKNIGFNGKFYTFPYFMTFLLKRFLEEKNELKEE